MESVSRSSGEDDEMGRTQRSSRRVELTVNVDGKSGEQKPGTPTTPRSKHSATEQRWRCKINDRFQILRDLIPHSDQKRDKASFLLEVIEYIKFLQEKVQKYESFPGWNQENEKLMPWSNYYATVGRGSGFMQPQERVISDSDNLVSQTQSEWQSSSCLADCTVSNDMLNEQEELTIDEGTISISSVYTQGLLTTVSQAMASAGVDMSQASISVQINLGRRASRRTTTTNMSSAKDRFDHSPINQVIGDSGRPESNIEGSEQAPKRQKVDTS